MKKILISLIIILFSLNLFGAEEQHVSSNTSSVFHRPTCRYAETLTELNATFYSSYEEAVADELRDCKVCKPVPTVIYPPEPPEPNTVDIIPSIDATSFFPTPNIIIQLEYCSREAKPDEVGTRIEEHTVSTILYQEVSEQLQCSICFTSDFVSAEYKTPVYDTADPNIIVSYIFSPDCPTYISDQSVYPHFDPICELLKSVPVHIVNIRTGAEAGSCGFWNPKQGTLEWRITPFDMGDYVAVMNSDIGQSQLGAITARSKQIPTLQKFTKYWLKGNFDFRKFAEWTRNRNERKKYLSLITTSNSTIEGRIEWVFQDGRWIPVASGGNPGDIINIDIDIVKNENEVKTTKTEETKIAAFEWRTTRITETTIKTTIFEGYDPYSPSPPIESLNYLYHPYTNSTISTLKDGTTEAELLAHYKEIGISPPPGEVPAPPAEEEIAKTVEEVNNSSFGGQVFLAQVSSDILDDYNTKKTAYANYLLEKENWEKLKEEKEAKWQIKIQEEYEEMESTE